MQGGEIYDSLFKKALILGATHILAFIIGFIIGGVFM